MKTLLILALATSVATAAEPDLRKQTKDALEMCHATAHIYYALDRSEKAKKEAFDCPEKGLRAVQFDAASAPASLKDYMAAWRAAMKNSPTSGIDPRNQRMTRERLGELWERYEIEK